MTLEENKATDIIDNPSDKIDPLNEGEDSNKLEEDVMRDLGSLEDDLMKIFKTAVTLDDNESKNEIYYTLMRNFSITNYEATTLDLGGEDVDFLLGNFEDKFSELTSSIEENPLVNERKEKLFNNEVTFDTIDQLNNAIKEDSDKILLLKGLSELGLKTTNFLILAGCMGLHGGIISLNTPSSKIQVPYIKLESSPKVIVFANGHLYEGKDERLACMDRISSTNNGNDEVPSNESNHSINFNGKNNNFGVVEVNGNYNGEITINKVSISPVVNAKIKQTETTNENAEEGDVSLVHTAVESTSVSAGVNTKIESGKGSFNIGVSGGFSNKRTLTHMEGIDGNSSVFDSFTLIDKETVNFTINGGYIRDGDNCLNILYNLESTGNIQTQNVSMTARVGGLGIKADGSTRKQEINDGEHSRTRQTNQFSLDLREEVADNFGIYASFNAVTGNEQKMGYGVGITNNVNEDRDEQAITYHMGISGERNEDSRLVEGKASINNIPVGPVNMDLKTGFSKQTDDNDNRVENFNVGLGLQAGDLQDWEKLGGTTSFNFERTENNRIPISIYTLNGSGNIPVGSISLAPGATYNRINENGEVTNNFKSTIGANIPVGPNSLLITPSFGFNSQKVGGNSAANNFIFGLNAQGQYGPLTVDRLTQYATGEKGGLNMEARLGLIVNNGSTGFNGGLTGSYNQDTGIYVGVNLFITY